MKFKDVQEVVSRGPIVIYHCCQPAPPPPRPPLNATSYHALTLTCAPRPKPP